MASPPGHILVCESDGVIATSYSAALKKERNKWDIVTNGKDAQAILFKTPYTTVFLDIDLKNHSGMEVLRYLKSSNKAIRVVIILANADRLNELGVTQKDIDKLGISETLTKPVTTEDLVLFMEGRGRAKAWRHLPEGAPTQINVPEGEKGMARMRTRDLIGGDLAMFDLWLRLSPQRLIKVFHEGEPFDDERLLRYASNAQGEWLYFKAEDRAKFIAHVNQVVEKVIASPNYEYGPQVQLVRAASDLLVEEIFTRGLRPDMVDGGNKLCRHVLDLARQDEKLAKAMNDFEAMDPNAWSANFLVAFFSSMIMARLPWGSPSVLEKVVMGALLHDLGKLRLPIELWEKDEVDMTEEQKKLFQKHPEFGMEMLDELPWVHESVKQVVYQHHEMSDGSGFPNRLTNAKTFPMAKIVSFANAFASFLRKHKLSPVEGMKVFLKEKGTVEKYDPLVMRTFLACYMDPEKARKL